MKHCVIKVSPLELCIAAARCDGKTFQRFIELPENTPAATVLQHCHPDLLVEYVNNTERTDITIAMRELDDFTTDHIVWGDTEYSDNFKARGDLYTLGLIKPVGEIDKAGANPLPVAVSLLGYVLETLGVESTPVRVSVWQHSRGTLPTLPGYEFYHAEPLVNADIIVSDTGEVSFCRNFNAITDTGEVSFRRNFNAIEQMAIAGAFKRQVAPAAYYDILRQRNPSAKIVTYGSDDPAAYDYLMDRSDEHLIFVPAETNNEVVTLYVKSIRPLTYLDWGLENPDVERRLNRGSIRIYVEPDFALTIPTLPERYFITKDKLSADVILSNDLTNLEPELYALICD